jgi:hypothetical protein
VPVSTKRERRRRSGLLSHANIDALSSLRPNLKIATDELCKRLREMP